MYKLPSRTGETHLTDNELILFDFLFDKIAATRFLARSIFPLHHNSPYTHNLSDDELDTAIDRLIDDGLLLASPDAETVTLTPEGGALWELERQPQWTKYCIDSQWQSDKPAQAWLSVQSPSLEVSRSFLEVASSVRLYQPVAVPELIQHYDFRLIPWKSFPTIFDLRVLVSKQENSSLNWASYTRQRTWWRDIQELDSLHNRR